MKVFYCSSLCKNDSFTNYENEIWIRLSNPTKIKFGYYDQEEWKENFI